MTDRESLPVAAARRGDSGAWDTLFRRYQLPLYSYVWELTHEDQTSLDIVQDTFISASQNLEGLRQDHKFGSWLFGIAHQKCAQHWRRHQPESVPLDEAGLDLVDAEADPRAWLIRQEQEEVFWQCLSCLSPAHRSVLMLHFLEEFALDEIAEITETELGTVKSRLYYAKKALRHLLLNTP